MPTYFETITVSYTQVPLKDGDQVDVPSFLEATENLIKLFDHINSTAFAPVKSDMQGNVDKLRTKYKTSPDTLGTLQAIVAAESADKKKMATEGLLWLKRGLEFTALALRRNVDDVNEELSVSFTKAYEVTLKQFHGMFVRPVFTLAMKACPYRKDFYTKLGGDFAMIAPQMKEWLGALEKIVGILGKLVDNIKL